MFDRRASFLLLGILLAGCSDGEPASQSAPALSAEETAVPLVVPQPMLTPAESAAAVAATAAHGDSVTEAVRGEPPTTPVHHERAEDQLDLCRKQAAQAEGAMREHISAACARMEQRAAAQP